MTQKEKEICKKYSARDENGFVHCKECPLVVDADGFMCKANSRYNRRTKEWERRLKQDRMKRNKRYAGSRKKRKVRRK